MTVGLLATLAAFLILQGAPPMPAPPDDQPLAPGQEWQYRNRPEDEDSTLIILRIDKEAPTGTIVHIAVKNVYLRGADFGPMQMQHMPFSEKPLRKSLVRMVAPKVPVPDYAEGYAMWKEVL